jgi:hypothetical protein
MTTFRIPRSKRKGQAQATEKRNREKQRINKNVGCEYLIVRLEPFHQINRLLANLAFPRIKGEKK